MSPAVRRLLVRARLVGSDTLQVPSPCVLVCRMDPDAGWCQGCLRTLDEIAGWSAFDEEDKRAVWRRIEGRALA